ncbi:MAG: TetR/AcrR family transcriptional regulator [Candidatus Abyssubacteria bacterium]
MSAEKLKTEVRKEQIAEAALEVAARNGIGGLNVAGIARRVGLVPSAIYRHYTCKDEILDAVFEVIGDRLVGNVWTVRAETPKALERLHRLLRMHVAFIRENQGVVRIVFSDDVFANPERQDKVFGMIQRYLRDVADIVSEGQVAGEIRPNIEPATVAMMFLGMIQPAAILWRMSEGKFDVTRHIEKAWLLFCDAIRRQDTKGER